MATYHEIQQDIKETTRPLSEAVLDCARERAKWLASTNGTKQALEDKTRGTLPT